MTTSDMKVKERFIAIGLSKVVISMEVFKLFLQTQVFSLFKFVMQAMCFSW
jgi:hypothetical protein